MTKIFRPDLALPPPKESIAAKKQSKTEPPISLKSPLHPDLYGDMAITLQPKTVDPQK